MLRGGWKKCMLDDIGLGEAIANLIYLILIAIGMGGVWLFLKKKSIFGVLFWLSFILNILAYLYFMGSYGFYSKIIYLLINKYWPWINLALLILLILNFLKGKYAKNN